MGKTTHHCTSITTLMEAAAAEMCQDEMIESLGNVSSRALHHTPTDFLDDNVLIKLQIFIADLHQHCTITVLWLGAPFCGTYCFASLFFHNNKRTQLILPMTKSTEGSTCTLLARETKQSKFGHQNRA